MDLSIFLAQVATDPISGASGWVSTGLVGGILGWLLYVHLPAKDKQILGLVESRDQLVSKLTAEFRASLESLLSQDKDKDKELRDDFKVSLQKVTDHAEREIEVIVSEIKKDVQKIVVDITELRRVKGE